LFDQSLEVVLSLTPGASLTQGPTKEKKKLSRPPGKTKRSVQGQIRRGSQCRAGNGGGPIDRWGRANKTHEREISRSKKKSAANKGKGKRGALKSAKFRATRIYQTRTATENNGRTSKSSTILSKGGRSVEDRQAGAFKVCLLGMSDETLYPIKRK